MGRKLQTIYEYFNEYSVDEVDIVIDNLTIEEKLIIRARYGDDLHNPDSTDNWNKELSEKYYGTLIPKMKKMLKSNIKENSVIEEKKVIKEESKILSVEKVNNNDIGVYPHLLIEEIRNGRTNTEICDKYNIDSNVLYKALLNLQNSGIETLRKYYSNGQIVYKPISTITDFKKNKFISQEKTIITDNNENEIKFLVISDLHFGNTGERLDLVDKSFNYCIKNGINNIICGGDFIDGSFTQGEQTIRDVYKQIEYFINNYPSDKNILTYGVAGDHDFSAFTENYINLVEICNNLRHDIIIGGFNNTTIAIKNDIIHLYHYVNKGEISQTNAPIILHGHSHKFATSIVNDVLNVTIPSLSNVVTDMPTALELNITFSRGLFKSVTIKQIYLGEKDIILNEQTHDLLKNRRPNYCAIKNIEAYKSNIIKEKVLKK